MRRALPDERVGVGSAPALAVLVIGGATGAVLPPGNSAVPLLVLAALLSGVQGLATD